MEWDKLWAINIKIIDPISPRYCAVGSDKVATLTITNYNGTGVNTYSIPLHQKNAALGERPIYRSANLLLEHDDALSFVQGEKVTLMKWGNIKVNEIITRPDGGLHLNAEELPGDTDFKSTKKVHWISKDTPNVQVDLVEFDHLIVVKKVEEDMELENILNHNSKIVTRAIGEPGIQSL